MTAQCCRLFVNAAGNFGGRFGVGNRDAKTVFARAGDPLHNGRRGGEPRRGPAAPPVRTERTVKLGPRRPFGKNVYARLEPDDIYRRGYRRFIVGDAEAEKGYARLRLAYGERYGGVRVVVFNDIFGTHFALSSLTNGER